MFFFVSHMTCQSSLSFNFCAGQRCHRSCNGRCWGPKADQCQSCEYPTVIVIVVVVVVIIVVVKVVVIIVVVVVLEVVVVIIVVVVLVVIVHVFGCPCDKVY